MAFKVRENRKETENKCVRFPVSLIEQIEIYIEKKDVSFSAFVIQACEYALENIDKDEKNTSENKSN